MTRRTFRTPADAETQRNQVVFRDGNSVYLWRIGAPPEALRVRRVALDRPARPRHDRMVFAGEEGASDPVPRRVQADRLRRLQARAALYATPATLCSTQDIADVFALRESDARACRPESARRIGRTWMAPFGDWLVALGVDLEGLAAQAEVPRVVRVRAPSAPTLRPLGGPTAGRR